jgi:replicative DNA helicase
MALGYIETLEEQIISSIIKEGSRFEQIRDFVNKDFFYFLPNSKMWTVFERMSDEDIFIEKSTVINYLKKLNELDTYTPKLGSPFGEDAIDYLVNLENANPELIESYAIQLTESKNSRDINELSEKIKVMLSNKKSSGEILSYLDIELGKISSNGAEAVSSAMKTLGQVVEDSIENLKKAVYGESEYLKTGLKAFDSLAGGLRAGRTYIVAGSSGDGKSALLENMAFNISLDETYVERVEKNMGKSIPNLKNSKVGFITLEMSSLEKLYRFYQQVTGIDAIRLGDGRVTDKELEEFHKYSTKWRSSNMIYFEDSSEMNVAQLRQKIRKMVSEGCKAIFIDQLQQIQMPQSLSNIANHVRYDFISYRIKSFAREFNVPIVFAHQMNRSADQAQNKNAELNLSNLSEGGERAADVVIFIRHKKENQQILASYLHWVKNRQGRKEVKRISFDGSKVKFSDYEGNFDDDDSEKG